jgi:hypothetical protein
VPTHFIAVFTAGTAGATGPSGPGAGK